MLPHRGLPPSWIKGSLSNGRGRGGRRDGRGDEGKVKGRGPLSWILGKPVSRLECAVIVVCIDWAHFCSDI